MPRGCIVVVQICPGSQKPPHRAPGVEQSVLYITRVLKRYFPCQKESSEMHSGCCWLQRLAHSEMMALGHLRPRPRFMPGTTRYPNRLVNSGVSNKAGVWRFGVTSRMQATEDDALDRQAEWSSKRTPVLRPSARGTVAVWHGKDRAQMRIS